MPTPRCFDAKPKESWGLKPFCPAWPTYALPAEPSSHLSDAVRRALRLFAAGVSAADLDAALGQYAVLTVLTISLAKHQSAHPCGQPPVGWFSGGVGARISTRRDEVPLLLQTPGG